MTKQEVVTRTLVLVGAPDMKLSPGSTEPKGYLTAVNDRLGLGLDVRLPKPRLAEAIARAGGAGWGVDCWGVDCWSAGSTVTLTGLTRVMGAVERLLAQRQNAP